MYNPKTTLPKNGWALVLAEQRQETLISGIILPNETGAEKVTEFPGEVIRLGGGDFNDALRRQGLVEGARILYRGYLKWANPLETGERWPDNLEKQYFFIDCKDIMGILEKDARVGIFSGRPSVPHIQERP